MTPTGITDPAYATALESGQIEAEREFRALSVRYLPDRDALEVITVRNGGFVIPRQLIGALRDVAPDDLARLDVWPDGSLIEVEDLDIHIAVDGMVRTALPVLVPARIVRGLFAASGGAARSPAKADSARENGKKGGRPRKPVIAA